MRKSGMTFEILLRAALVVGACVLLLHFFPAHHAVCAAGLLLLTTALLIRRHKKQKNELPDTRRISFSSETDPENDGEFPTDIERIRSGRASRAEAQKEKKKEKSVGKGRNGNARSPKDEGYLGIGLDSVEEEVFFWDDDD